MEDKSLIISFAVLKRHLSSFRILKIEAEARAASTRKKKVLIFNGDIEYDEGREIIGIDFGDFDQHAFGLPNHLVELHKVKKVGDGIYRGKKLWYDKRRGIFIIEGDGRWFNNPPKRR